MAAVVAACRQAARRSARAPPAVRAWAATRWAVRAETARMRDSVGKVPPVRLVVVAAAAEPRHSRLQSRTARPQRVMARAVVVAAARMEIVVRWRLVRGALVSRES